MTAITSISLPKNTSPLQYEEISQTLEIADDTGHRLYLVGGYLRDALGSHLPSGERVPKDFDFAVEGGSAFAFASLVATKLGGHFVPLDEGTDTARVVLDHGTIIDFAGCVDGTIGSDVWRRDFSINALVWDPTRPDEILDYVSGYKDLQNKKVRALSETSFIEDPLRLLRAFRFAAMIDGTIDDETIQWIRTHAKLIGYVAVERVDVELFAILNRPCVKPLTELAEFGILDVIFPELAETKKVPPNAFHHLGLFEHSLETIPQLESKLPTLPEWMHASLRKELSPGVTRLAATKLACLLHDIGKPQTWQVTPEGRHSFHGHDKLGAEMSEEIGEGMHWSKALNKFVSKLIKWHLRPGALFHQGPPTDRAIRRFYRDIDEDLPELMLLAFADFGATCGPEMLGAERKNLEQSLSDLMNGYPAFKAASEARVKLLDGNDVMALLGIPAGPVIGEILDELAEAQEFNEVSDRADAERFVRDRYAQKYSK